MTHDSWFTPTSLLLALPPILFDPCWHPDSNVVTERHLCVLDGDDGLGTPWPLIEDGPGIIFVNPPYSNLSKWLRKIAWEAQRQVLPIVTLIPSKPGESYWAVDVFPAIQWFAFPPGRLSFDTFAPYTGKSVPGTFPSVLCCYGTEEQAEEVWRCLKISDTLWPFVRVQAVDGVQAARRVAVAKRGNR